MKAQYYLNIGYQKILTFERPGGGFDWWGNGPALVWLTAYGVQQLTALSRVKEIDTGVIDRARNFLRSKQSSDGSWNVVGSTHGETISRVKNPPFALTSYVVWSLADAGYKGDEVKKGCAYLRKHLSSVQDSPYLLALAANAFLSVSETDFDGLTILKRLIELKKENKNQVYWKISGQTASCARGNSANIETTAMIVLALLKSKKHTDIASKALSFIVESKGSYGAWGSTQATILALQCLVKAELMKTSGGTSEIEIFLNNAKITTWKIDDTNRDVMKFLDLSKQTKKGKNKVTIKVSKNPNIMYQVVGRYYKPWKHSPVKQKKILELSVKYDRKTLKKHDTIKATATLKYNGSKPTFMVIIDLGIPPGFTVDKGDFAELLGKTVRRYSITANQVTLYLGDINPGQLFTCNYHLKAKYPIKAKTPKSVAYEYYTPSVKGVAKPIEIEVK